LNSIWHFQCVNRELSGNVQLMTLFALASLESITLNRGYT